MFEAAPRAGGHTNTVARRSRRCDATTSTPASSSTTTATTRASSALLAELGVPAQPSDMSFGVADTRGDFEYCGASPNGLFANRAHLVQPWFHRMVAEICASTARRARCSTTRRRRRRRSATGCTSARYSAAFVERLIVPQASAVWSADPRQMWTLPGALPRRASSHNHGMLGAARPPAVAHGRRRLARATSRRSSRPWRDRIRARHAGHGDPAPRRPRRGARRAAASPSASTRSSSPRTPTRRCGMLADAERPRARAPRRDPVPAQRGRAAHRPRAAARGAAGRGRAGTTTCSPSPTGMHDRDLPHEPPAGARPPTASSA